MVVIRLTRAGTNKRPFYHIAVADKRRARDSRFIERLGYYNPISTAKDSLNLNIERIDYWLAKGAQPSERVQHLIEEFKNPQAKEVKDVKKQKAKEKVKLAKIKEAEKAAAAKAEQNEPTAAVSSAEVSSGQDQDSKKE
jgi:small subunit ribosomal protein S16